MDHAPVVYGIFSALFLANLFMLIFGLMAIRVAGKLVQVPNAVLMPIVLVLCGVGSFAVNNSFFDVGVMAVLGIVGYFMVKTGFPQAPMLLGMILGPLAEANFRRALSVSRDDLTVFITQPICCIILIAAFGVLANSFYKEIKTFRGKHTTDA